MLNLYVSCIKQVGIFSFSYRDHYAFSQPAYGVVGDYWILAIINGKEVVLGHLKYFLIVLNL